MHPTEETKDAPGEKNTHDLVLEQQQALEQLDKRQKQLDGRLSYLQGELDGIEARRRQRQKVLALLLLGFCYGILAAMILD